MAVVLVFGVATGYTRSTIWYLDGLEASIARSRSPALNLLEDDCWKAVVEI